MNFFRIFLIKRVRFFHVGTESDIDLKFDVNFCSFFNNLEKNAQNYIAIIRALYTIANQNIRKVISRFRDFTIQFRHRRNVFCMYLCTS